MVCPNNDERKESFKQLATGFDIASFIYKLKQKANKDKSDEIYLALFVLQILWLENDIKALLNFLGLKKELWEDKELGKIINCCECSLLKISIFANQIKKLSSSERKILNCNYIASFIKDCKEIKKIRNDLYHNLPKLSCKRLKSILREIKRKLEINLVSYNSGLFLNLLNIGSARMYKKRLIYRNSLPKNYSLDVLIAVCSKFVQIAKKIAKKT